MSIAPVVIKSRSTPFLSIACAVLVVYFIVKALVFRGEIGVFSLMVGAVVALVGIWGLLRSQGSSVVIDDDQFVINRGGNTVIHRRSDVAEVDLSGLDRHLTLTDGTGVRLPLEGADLVHAGILLSPTRQGPSR